MPKSKKKDATTAMKVNSKVKKAPGKPNSLSMYNSVLPKSSRKSSSNVGPKKLSKCPEKPPEPPVVEVPVESKVVEDKVLKFYIFLSKIGVIIHCYDCYRSKRSN